jgi:NADH:ubiquinone oxidoreductase subunit 6 (subunit J)
MKIFPVPDKEIHVTWRRTLTNGLFASRHGVMVIAANLAAYAAMLTLYRSLEPRAHSQWVLVTGTFLAIATLSLVSVYMFQLYTVSKSVVTDPTTNEQQLGAVLTSSYIGFRIYVVLLLVACGLEGGIASILRR